MSYQKIREWFSPQGCRIITILAVAKSGNIMTPTEHVFLEGPDEEKKLANGVDKRN